MKTKIISVITCIVGILALLIVTGCFEQEVVSDVIGQIAPDNTSPEPTPVELPPGEGLALGVQAPEFSLSDADGNIHSLSNYAGQKVALVFYATWG